MTPDREKALRRIGSTWLGLTKSEVDELLAEIDRLRAENEQIKKSHEANLCRWEVVDGEFRTTREKQLRNKLAVALDALEHAHEKHDYCGQVEDAITKLKQQDKEI